MTVASGTEIAFNFQESNHTVVTSAHPGASQITINNGGGDFDGVPIGQIRKVIVTGSSGGMIQYNCGIHGPSMDGTITIS
jgi:plastocyanin